MVRERPARCSRTFACSIANIGDRAKKSSIGWTPGPTPTIVHSSRLKVAAGVCMAVGVGRQDSLQQFLLEAVRIACSALCSIISDLILLWSILRSDYLAATCFCAMSLIFSDLPAWATFAARPL